MYAYSGGKTGGHIMPLISIIKESNNDSIYIGEQGNLEEKICKENNIKFIGLSKKYNKVINIIKGYSFLRKQLREYKIEALICSGGYVSVAACIYAIREKIPIFLLEENVIIGTVNKVFYPFCKKMLLSYDVNKKGKKYNVVGMPIRKDNTDFINKKYDVLVIGGSLGSRVLCDVAVDISKHFKTCLIAGRFYKDYKESKNLKIIEFSTDIYRLMKESMVIIARAGASTIAEVLYLNLPFICIPSMKTKKNHQFYNAKYFSDANACIMCLENELDNAIGYVQNILNNDSLKVNMLNAQRKIFKENSASIILKIIKENI